MIKDKEDWKRGVKREQAMADARRLHWHKCSEFPLPTDGPFYLAAIAPKSGGWVVTRETNAPAALVGRSPELWYWAPDLLGLPFPA